MHTHLRTAALTGGRAQQGAVNETRIDVLCRLGRHHAGDRTHDGCGTGTRHRPWGGSLGFEFGDADVSTVPGPEFDTDETGSVGDISLYLRNRRVQAGVTLSLAQGSENVTSIGTEDEVPFPLDNAYIRLSDLFGIFRMNLRLRGKETSLGTIAVTGTEPDPVEENLDYRASDGVITLDVERGVLGDVYLGIEANQIAGRAETPMTEAVDHIWGVKALTGYEARVGLWLCERRRVQHAVSG